MGNIFPHLKKILATIFVILKHFSPKSFMEGCIVLENNMRKFIHTNKYNFVPVNKYNFKDLLLKRALMFVVVNLCT